MLYDTPPLRMARLRCELRPHTVLRISPERQGEVLYGAFANGMRRMACDRQCRGAIFCARRDECAYARLFEPDSAAGAVFGARDVKAFLFRPSLDESGDFGPHRPLVFELRLFGRVIDDAPLFVEAFRNISRHGLADRAVDPMSVVSLDLTGPDARVLLLDEKTTGAAPLTLRFDPLIEIPGDGDRVHIDYLTATWLREAGRDVRTPLFATLVRRVRDRLSVLCRVWEGLDWLADHGQIAAVAAKARVRANVQWGEYARVSSHNGQTMRVKGLRGECDYAGVDRSLWPLLRIGEEIHAGRLVVWGNGRYRAQWLHEPSS